MMPRPLRRIQFPEHLNVCQPVIKSGVFYFVEKYEQIIEDANRQAKNIIHQATLEAQRIIESVREEVSDSLQGDLQALKALVMAHDKEIRHQSMAVCARICSAVLERFTNQLCDEEKIACLISELLIQVHNARQLNIRCHPSQIDLVRQQLADHLAEQFNLTNWLVDGDETLDLFDLKLQASNGSEIRIQLKNVLALYAREIELFLSQSDIHHGR